jgi:hypothetical protein
MRAEIFVREYSLLDVTIWSWDLFYGVQDHSIAKAIEDYTV